MNPFDYLNNITTGKENILLTNPEMADKIPIYLILRGLSMSKDTVLYANQMNDAGFISDRMKYDYLFHSIRKRKRFEKWAKESTPEFLEEVQEYYGYNREKALQALQALYKLF